MSRLKWLAVALLPCLALASSTWYVDATNGSDNNSGLSVTAAKASIQAAIDCAGEGDRILVSPGVYSPINSNAKKICIEGTGRIDDVIIDGGCTTPCAIMSDEVDTTTNTCLKGFTLRNGFCDEAWGATKRGRIENCIVTGCTGWGIVHATQAYNCLVVSNTVTRYGVFIHSGAHNCTIVNNTSSYAGWDVGFENVLCWQSGGRYTSYGQPVSWYNCYLSSSEHMFVDAANGDYRLAADSPCIDAGDNSYVTSDTDLGGSKRIVNGTVDIGCYEFYPVPRTWYVDAANGSDSNSGLSKAEAKASIQSAIDCAVDDDTILVDAGEYAPFATSNKCIKVIAAKGAGATVIDALESSMDGIDCQDHAAADLRYSTNTVVTGFTVKNAKMGILGGVAVGCIMRDNADHGIGWGIARNCLIVNNSRGAIGALCINCTFVGNHGSTPWDVSYCSSLNNCIAYGNGNNLIFNGFEDGTELWQVLGYTAKNCVYTDDPTFVDAANGDYRLAAGSPCIDAGDNAYVMDDADLDGNTRIVGGTVDIGCYEKPLPFCDDGLMATADKTDGDTFCFSTTLTVTAKEGCTLYYTLDGSEPTTNSAVYAAPLTITDTTTVKYFVTEPAFGNWSPVGSITLTRVPAESGYIVVTPSVADGTKIVGDQPVELTAGEGEVIWYTVDGSDPMTSDTRQKYTEAIQMTSDTTLKYYAVNGYGDWGAVQTVQYTWRAADGGPYSETVDGIAWSYTVADGNATIYKSQYSAAIDKTITGAIAIPSTLGGCPVTRVGDMAFRDCKGLTTVAIPSSMIDLGTYSAFGGCTGITDFIVDQDNPNYVSSSGFIYSKDGKSLILCPRGRACACEIPEGVTHIGARAFAFSSFTEVSVPASVTGIGSEAINYYSAITNINVSMENLNYKSVAGVLFTKDGLQLVEYPLGRHDDFYEVPEGVTWICDQAFEGDASLASVSFPESLKGIGRYSFYNCWGLKTLRIPNGVTRIRDYAFRSCWGLSTIIFEGNAPAIDGGAFSNCPSECTAFVEYGSMGWGVDIPGTWNGINIRYLPYCDESLMATSDKTDGDTFGIVTTLALTAKEGCDIYYTLDGSEPTTNSAVYAAPLAFTETTTVKYFVTEPASGNWSPVGSITLTRVPAESGDIVVTPSVADGTRFADEQSVALASGEGETIWYTVDGSDPMTSETRQQYTEAITMTEDTTLKYYAVDRHGDWSAVQTVQYIRRMNDGGPYWEVVEGLAWCFTVANGESMVLEATNLVGVAKGRAFGAVVIPEYLGKSPVTAIEESAFERCYSLSSVTIPASVTNIGYFAFRDCLRLAEVKFLGNRPHVDLGAFMGVPAYAVVSSKTGSVTAVLPTEVNGNVVSVPEGWLDEIATRHKGDTPAGYSSYEEAFVAKYGSDLTKALAKPTGKRDTQGNAMMVWQDFVAGTDPLDEEDTFQATVTLEDGVPVVRWLPELTAAEAAKRNYKTYAKTALKDGAEWTDVTALTDEARQEAGYQFFKVTVEMK